MKDSADFDSYEFSGPVPIRWSAAAIVGNLVPPPHPIDLKVGLGSRLAICGFTESDIPDWISGTFPSMSPAEDRVAFALSQDVSGTEHDHGFGTMRGLLSELQTGLRLVKPGRVWVPDVFTRSLDSGYMTTGVIAPDWEPWIRAARSDEPPDPFILDSADIDSLVSILDCLSRRPVHKGKIEVSLVRFNLAYDRLNPDDQIVDLFICLEALFGSRSGGSRESVARGASSFIEADPRRVAELDRFLRKLYDVRCDIVHGRDMPGLSAGVAALEEIVRRCLTKALLDPSSLSSERDKNNAVPRLPPLEWLLPTTAQKEAPSLQAANLVVTVTVEVGRPNKAETPEEWAARISATVREIAEGIDRNRGARTSGISKPNVGGDLLVSLKVRLNPDNVADDDHEAAIAAAFRALADDIEDDGLEGEAAWTVEYSIESGVDDDPTV